MIEAKTHRCETTKSRFLQLQEEGRPPTFTDVTELR